ncbi:Hypothetical_protein [Hexamita inflata]|uniref:Hypothetical_protein n=1 Tax=Hexamita inflata TaxID=28002 RepID=A0ABP1LT37_9EUKA
MLQYVLILSVCPQNSINISNSCKQLFKSNIGVYYTSGSTNKYIMCYQNYVLSQSKCNLIKQQDPNINQVVTTFTAVTKPQFICKACIADYVIDYNTHVCTALRIIQFTQITCNGYINVATDLSMINFDQVALCALTADSSFATNSILYFETTVTVAQSTAIGLFAQTTMFSNMVIRGSMNIKQTKTLSQVFIGSLTGIMNTNMIMQNCSIKITIKLDSGSQQTVFKAGGLVGMIQGKYTLQVQNCTVQLTTELTNQFDYVAKYFYSVVGGMVGHMHLLPTLQVLNSTTINNLFTTRAAGGYLGMFQGGYILIQNSNSSGSLNAYACGGLIGEGGAPGGLTPTQAEQLTIDTVSVNVQMTGTVLGAAFGNGCKKSVLTFAGVNYWGINGLCPVGAANGLTYSGVTGC